MTTQRIIISLRRFGIKGVWNWVLRLFSNKTDSLLGALQAHIDPNITPTRGITMIGDINGHYSLSKVLRDFACSLKEAGIPFQTVDIKDSIPANLVLNRYSDIVTMTYDYKLTRLNGCRQHRIVFWEFDRGLTELIPELIDGNPIITFSQFCHDSIKKQVHPQTCVNLLRYPFHFDAPEITPPAEVRGKYNIDQDAFVVFYNFDYHSSYYRKNPEGLLHAFAKAFKDTPDAVLVLKTNQRVKHIPLAEKLERMATDSGIGDRVRFINDYISTEELVSLTAACDVYASLHRGEGFGLGMAEAMSLGKPVIATSYGANTEFCTRDTSILIPYTTVPILPEQRDSSNYEYLYEWPEPDIDAAASSLRKLYDNPVERKQMGLRAKAFIKQYYSVENFKRSMDAFFDRSL